MNLKQLLRLESLALIVSLVVLPRGAAAQAPTQCDCVFGATTTSTVSNFYAGPPPNINPGLTIGVQKFNPSLGVLVKVEYGAEVRLTSASSSFQNTNTSASCTLNGITFTLNNFVSAPAGVTPTAMFPGGALFNCSQTGLNVTLQRFGTAGDTFTSVCSPPEPPPRTSLAVLCSDQPQIAAFVGTGNVLFPIGTQANQGQATNCSNLDPDFNSSIRVTITVKYTYCEFGAGPDGARDAISREVSFGVAEPDLSFDAAGMELPIEGSVNQLFHVRWRVRNTGDGVAPGPWTDRIEFSTPVQLAPLDLVMTYDAVAPPTLAPGAFYDRDISFLMPQNAITFTATLRTDLNSVVQESDESNNLSGPHTITVHALPRPNLRVEVTEPPAANPMAGNFVALSFRVWNDGDAPTSVPQWSDGVYLVRDVDDDGIPPTSEVPNADSSLFPNSFYLQNDQGGTGSLPGTSYPQTAAAVHIPATASGKYFLAVRTDALQAQDETNEADNLTFSDAFTVQAAPRPNLGVSSIDTPEAPVLGIPLPSGTALTIAWRITNSGPANYPGGSFKNEISISTNPDTDGPTALDNDQTLASFTQALGALGPGNTSPWSNQSVVIPPNLADGNYYFKVRIDVDDALAEAETIGVLPYWNNIKVRGAFPIFFAGTPDLFASDIGLMPGQGTPQAGHSMKVKWHVENHGIEIWNVPLTWVDRVWLSKGDSIISADGILSGNDRVIDETQESTALVDGKWIVPNYAKTRTIVLPEDIQTGTDYFLILVTDADEQIFESSGNGELNNTSSSATPIDRHPADLSIVANAAGGTLTPPTKGAPGQAITLPWTVRNDSTAGSTSTPSWTDHIWLSPSVADLVGAKSVLSASHSGVLQPGGSYSEVRQANVPFVDPGSSWWLHFITDMSGAVFEDDPTPNNSFVMPFDVTNLVADLVVDQVSATQRMRPGQPVSVHWTVRNAGSAATGVPSWGDTIYLADAPRLAQSSVHWQLVTWGHTTPLGAGLSYPVTRSFALPLGISPGPWYVIAHADATGSVVESDENNNTRSTRTLVEIEAPGPGGGGGGGGDTGGGWLPANLVPRDVQILNSPVTAGQNVQLSWKIVNDGIGVTNMSSWTDDVYLSIDGVLGPGDLFLDRHEHTSFLDVDEVRPVTETYAVPLGANAAWVVLVQTNSNHAVFQGEATSDDVAASATLLQVVPPIPTDLEVASVALPPVAYLGETFAFDWTTRNNSPSTVPAEWNWTDRFWLLREGATFPSDQAYLLGQVASDAGSLVANGGTHVQHSSAACPELKVPGVPPGFYRLVVQSDALNQIAELDEANNLHASISDSPVELQAIELLSDDFVTVDVPNGASRWFRLVALANQTIDLQFEHHDLSARCELYVRKGTLPSLGVFDLASEGLDAIDPHIQSVRIPRTSGADYFILARTVSGAGTGSCGETGAVVDAQLDAIRREFEVSDVEPSTVGAGVVTVAVHGAELWLAAPPPEDSVELREVALNGHIEHSLDTELLEDGTLLARFDLTDAPLGAYTLFVIDNGVAPGAPAHEVSWSGTVFVEPPEPLALRAGLDVAPNVRRGESGAGVLRVTNAGNVDVPYAMASLGHLHQPGSADAVQRVTITSPGPSLGGPGGGSDRESFVAVVEDLRPGGAHDVALEFAVGAEYPLEGAAFGVAGVPATKLAFLQGAFLELSRALRTAVASDPATPALLSGVAEDPRAWDGLVASGVASGSIAIDTGSLHLPTSSARSAREILQAIADGIAQEVSLPTGNVIPPSAIDGAARLAWCAPFSGLGFECESLFPPECSGGSADVSVTTVVGNNVPTGSVCVATPAPHDPNEKLPQPGVGPQGLVSANRPVTYQVQFENQVGATAWASRIVITDHLEPTFRSSSVRFKALRIGRTTFSFPANTPSFLGRIPLSIDETTTIDCQVSALVIASTDMILVTLVALDPVTGLPTSAGNRGLLPPNAVGLELEATGYVTFSVRPETEAPGALAASTASGQIIVNTTTIQMNAAPPLQTNTTYNMLDGGVPGSMLAVESVVGATIHLAWSAGDTEKLTSGEFPGSGVRTYSLSVGPTEKGPWTAVLTDTPATSHSFTGTLGETFAFKVEATDAVGNVESKDMADVIVPLLDCNGNRIWDGQDIVSGNFPDANGNGVPDVCDCTGLNFCVTTPDATGLAAHISGVGVPSISGGNYTLTVSQTPPFRRGLFLYGTETQEAPFGGGFLCLSGTVIRLQPLLVTNASGSASLPLNFSGPPLGVGPTHISPGSTRYFQFWFRSFNPLTFARVDLSDGLKVTFCN